MTFLTRMKCQLVVSLCILVGLSIFSPSPVLAVANSSGSLWIAPYTNKSPSEPVSMSLYQMDYSATQSFQPSDLTDLLIQPLESAGIQVTATGDLKFDNGAAIARQDYVTLLCASVRPDGSIYNTYLNRVEVDRNGLIILDEDEICLGVLDTFQSGNAGQIGGDISLEFEIPPNANPYEIQFKDNASSVVNMVDSYPGPWLQFDTVHNGIFFSFANFSYLYRSSIYDLPLEEQPGLSLKAGNTYRVSFPIINPPNLIRPVLYHYISTRGSASDFDYTSSIGDLYVRNIGTAAAPQLQYIYWISFDIVCYTDTVIDYIYLYASNDPFWGCGNYPTIEIIDSDAVVSSKLQQLLDYYSANPPEADDLKGQSDMQKELEEAAIQDAQTNLDQAGQAAAPGTVLLPDITITSSITSFTSALGQLFVGIPWLAGLIAFVVFSIIIRALLGR